MSLEAFSNNTYKIVNNYKVAQDVKMHESNSTQQQQAAASFL